YPPERVKHIGAAQPRPGNKHVDRPRYQPVRPGQRLQTAEMRRSGVDQDSQQHPAEPRPEARAPQDVPEVANLRVGQLHPAPPSAPQGSARLNNLPAVTTRARTSSLFVK